jgi:hypothetical protein
MQSTHKRMVQFQKLLIKKCISPLHGHKIHRQQRELSKYLKHYSSSLLMLTVATGQASKMASQQEKVFSVLRFEVSRSVITVQRQFRKP